MSLLDHLCNRERDVEAARRNAALPPARQEASTSRIHKEPSPVPATHAGEGSRIKEVEDPAEQLAILKAHYGSEWTVAEKLNIPLLYLLCLNSGTIKRLSDDNQARRLREAAESLLDGEETSG